MKRFKLLTPSDFLFRDRIELYSDTILVVFLWILFYASYCWIFLYRLRPANNLIIIFTIDLSFRFIAFFISISVIITTKLHDFCVDKKMLYYRSSPSKLHCIASPSIFNISHLPLKQLSSEVSLWKWPWNSISKGCFPHGYIAPPRQVRSSGPGYNPRYSKCPQTQMPPNAKRSVR